MRKFLNTIKIVVAGLVVLLVFGGMICFYGHLLFQGYSRMTWECNTWTVRTETWTDYTKTPPDIIRREYPHCSNYSRK